MRKNRRNIEKKLGFSILIKAAPFPEKWSNAPPERFFAFFSETTAVFEKIVL